MIKRKILASLILSGSLLMGNANAETAVEAVPQSSAQAVQNQSSTPQEKLTTPQVQDKKITSKSGTEITWKGDEEKLSYDEFRKDIEQGEVDTVIFSADISENLQARVLLKSGDQRIVYLVSRNLDTFAQNLKDKGVKVEVVQSFSALEQEGQSAFQVAFGVIFSVVKMLAYLVMYIMLFVFIMMFIQKRMLGMRSNKNKKINPKDIQITFNDIAGHDEEKRDIMEVVEFMKNKKKYDKLGAQLPRGILLSGPPGNGKTMFAKAIAKECNADFFQCSGSEFIEVFAGLGASRVRDLFKKARKSKRSVIFIDEIDTLGKKRGGMSSHNESEQTLNQLLAEMDGFNSREHEVLVIAATNRIDVLDEALLRPGRFDRKIVINKPSRKGRAEIINVYLNKLQIEGEGKLSPDINVDLLSRITEGFSGAEIANLVNEALIRAAKRNSTQLTQKDLMDARSKLLMGDPRHDMDLVEKERYATAVHEAGHAIVALTVSRDPIEAVTITPHSHALGFVLRVSEKESWTQSKDQLNKEMQIYMGGRAAEEVFINEISNGAANDMEKAYELAMAMTTKWGMGEVLATISLQDLNTLSDGTRQLVDREVIELVRSNYDEAKTILTRYPAVMDKMVSTLMEKETMNKEEVTLLWKQETGLEPHWEHHRRVFLGKTD